MPFRTDIDFLNNKGVFSSGINSIIQSLARQRKTGDIYVIMPLPLLIDKDSLPYSEETNENIENVFLKYAGFKNKKVKYSNINFQAKELDEVYSKLKQYVSESKKKISEIERRGMNRLLYPAKEIFIMSKGEKFLTQNFFNGDLSSYMFWAAITNQFQNCKLTSIIKDERVDYKTETLYSEIVNLYQDLVFSSPFDVEGETYLDYFSYYTLYYEMENEIIGNKMVYIDDNSATKKQIELIKIYILNLVIFNDIENRSEDDYNELRQRIREFYLESCLFHSRIIELNENNTININFGIYEMDELNSERVKLYKEWLPFIELINSKIQNIPAKRKSLERSILPKKPFQEFKELFEEKEMELKIKELMGLDRFISENVIPFKDAFGKATNLVNTFYSLLVELQYNTESVQMGKDKKRVYSLKNKSFKNIEKVNLLYDLIPIMTF